MKWCGFSSSSFIFVCREATMRKFTIALFLALGACFTALPFALSRQTTPAQSTASSRRSEAMAPMRDGIKLATAIFLPEGNGPWPVVLVRTPYGKDTQGGTASAWTGRGFAFVIQDCRGLYKS